MSRRLLTKEQVAEWFGQSVASTVAAARNGRVPAIKLPNGEWRFDEAELLEFLEQRKSGPRMNATRKRRAKDARAVKAIGEMRKGL